MTTPLALHDRHTDAGATCTALGEREMVSAYGDAAAEVGAVRAATGILDWGGGTRLRVTHTGARTAHDFLQGLLSNDVPTEPTQPGCYATLLTNTGKIIADCRVWAETDSFLLTAESAAGGRLRDALAKYGFLDDVEVTDISDALGLLGLHGPRAAQVFDVAFGATLPGLEPHVLYTVATEIGDVRVARTAVTGEVGFDVFIEAAQLDAAWAALTGAGATPIGLDAFHILRVEAGVPWMDAELDEQVIPNQVGLDHAVSFTKGCYVGQEAVAKLHYLGRTNRRLVGLLLGDAAPPEHGALLLVAGKRVGRITSAVVSTTCNQTIAIALCKNAHAEPGTTIEVEGAGGATVAALPFHSSDPGFRPLPHAQSFEGLQPPGIG